MNSIVFKSSAYILGVGINYWLISTYFPIVWKSLNPLFAFFIVILLIVFLAIGSGIVSAIDSGFSGEIPETQSNVSESKTIIVFNWIILFPLRLFVFTFFLYLVTSYYWKVYSNIYHHPELMNNLGRGWPIIIAPFFALFLGVVCGICWIYGKSKKTKI